ncbi:MAG: IPT/TIG domain-containing protein [Gammaproteobacteria bacterium]
MIISGSNFGGTRPIVTFGDRVVKVTRHSAREVVVEIPEGVPMGAIA